MYDLDPEKRTPIFYVIAIFVLSFGSLWLGSYGLNLKFNWNNSNADQNILNNNATVIDSIASFKDIISETSNSIHQSVSKPTISSPSTTILIGGDVMLDRKIRLLGQEKGYDSLLSSVAPLFKSADISVVNLEGPITSYPSKTLLANGVLTKDMSFTFAPGSTKALSKAGITAVSLANNHGDNFGEKGVVETKQWLKQSNLEWFGSPWNASSTELIIQKNGMSIAFIGYHAFQPGITRILYDIKRLSSEGNFVIVMPHWGNEYATTSTEAMRDQAKEMIGAGAKAIIGSHPHVIMNNEVIAGVPVYYSIGNLLFDQYFSTDVTKGEIISLKLVYGPDGPSIDSVGAYNTRLDKIYGVVLE
ncbi:MAG: CapA family protein [Candidatus Taylorbacteria bacterium]